MLSVSRPRALLTGMALRSVVLRVFAPAALGVVSRSVLAGRVTAFSGHFL